MEKALQIQKKVKEILGGAEVHLVGGAVRDLVLGKEPKDWDFNTPLEAEEVERLVKEAGRRAYTTGARFGTIGFKVEVEETNDYGGGDPGWFGPQWHSAKYFVYIEVTTYRGEKYKPGSRKPEVTFIDSLYDDLARRDFTINAMALNDDGTIYDPFGGQLDILVKQIKAVGVPKDRLNDDPLRIFRAARFASQLGFKIEPNLAGKARQLANNIFDVSIERWVQELDKLLIGRYNSVGLVELDRLGVLPLVFPELSYWKNAVEPFLEGAPEFETPEDGHTYLFSSIGRTIVEDKQGNIKVRNNDKLRKYIVKSVCQRLKFSNERTKKLTE